MHSSHPAAPIEYEIELAATLDERWSRWFVGMRAEQTGRATTRLIGDMLDQAQLHGVLAQIRDLGLEIVSVTRRRPDEVDPPSDRLGAPGSAGT